MTLEEFKKTLSHAEPPDVAPLLVALWHAENDRWDAAHEIVQSIDTADGAWIHAHLHRRGWFARRYQ